MDELRNDYFEWLISKVCYGVYSTKTSYRKLLIHLHLTPFTYTMMMDENREGDGLYLRELFSNESGYPYNLCVNQGPCTILEMMVGLASRCEIQIMSNQELGDRTGQWFWMMIDNLELSYYRDYRFSKIEVNRKLNRFLERDFKSNGEGGLFVVDDPKQDMRQLEIWYQMCAYLNSIAL